jgi:hypothetical protein
MMQWFWRLMGWLFFPAHMKHAHPDAIEAVYNGTLQQTYFQCRECGEVL